MLARPPPREDDSSPASFIVRHGLDESGEDPHARVAFATRVRLETQVVGDAYWLVDELVSVESRVFSPVLAVERAVTRRVAAGSRAGLRLVTRGSDALSHRVGGKGGVAIQRGTSITVATLEWLGATVRGAIHAVLQAPDRLWQGAATSGAHLSRRRERKELLLGLFNPHQLSREGKVAALFVAGSILAMLALVVTLSVFFARPDLAEEWRAVLLYFGMGLLGTLLLPLFPEFQLSTVAAEVGGPAAILTISLGMTAGAWLVLFLGDAIHGTIRSSITAGSLVDRAFSRAETFAQKRGFWAAFLILSIPLGPDTIVFYTLATLRTPPRWYLLGTLLGTLLRFSLWYYVPIVYYDVLLGDAYVAPSG